MDALGFAAAVVPGRCLTHISSVTGRRVLTGEHASNPVGYLRVLLERIPHFLALDKSCRTRAARHCDAQRHQAETRARLAQRAAERAAERARAHSPEGTAAREDFFTTWRTQPGRRSQDGGITDTD